MKLNQDLAAERWTELRHGRYHWWVAPAGAVAVKDPRTGVLGVGRTVAMAFANMQNKAEAAHRVCE